MPRVLTEIRQYPDWVTLKNLGWVWLFEYVSIYK